MRRMHIGTISIGGDPDEDFFRIHTDGTHANYLSLDEIKIFARSKPEGSGPSLIDGWHLPWGSIIRARYRRGIYMCKNR